MSDIRIVPNKDKGKNQYKQPDEEELDIIRFLVAEYNGNYRNENYVKMQIVRRRFLYGNSH